MSFVLLAMKCLPFLFTLCSVGRFFAQGQNESAQSSGSSQEEGNQNQDGGTDVTSNAASSKEDLPQNEEVSSSSSFSEENQDKQQGPKSDDKERKKFEEVKRQFAMEMAAGVQADVLGQNEHIRQASSYEDFGRRSVPKAAENTVAENDNHLIPEKAPPELVLLVAKESALMGTGKDMDLGSDFDQKKILRSGDYWNGVWKEEVKPKSALRSGTEKKNLGSIKARIIPGTELYKVVKQMKEISPKLLYIINKKQI